MVRQGRSSAASQVLPLEVSPPSRLGNLGLSPSDEAAIVAYLKTLSDGYQPPAAAPTPPARTATPSVSPRVTLPPTNTLSAPDSSPRGPAFGVVLLALVGLAGSLGLVDVARRRRDRRG